MYFTSRRAAKYPSDNPERLRRYAPDADNTFFNTTNIIAAARLMLYTLLQYNKVCLYKMAQGLHNLKMAQAKKISSREKLPALDKHASFFQDVWDVARQIPKGRVTSYGAIAQYLGAKSSARMVGWAMNAVHDVKDIPAHRVVNRNGMLSGKAHFSPPEKMERLLKKEGIKIKDDTVQDFKKVFWNPSEALNL